MRFTNSLRLLFTLICWSSLVMVVSGQEIDVWIGTSSQPPSQGIYHCRLNTQTGRLTQSQLVAEITGPGFLAMHPREPVLYAVGVLSGVDSVVAYRVSSDDDSASLQLINSLATGDGRASHVSVNSTGDQLLTAQYGGGSVSSFRLAEDGSIAERVSVIKHEGGSRVFEDRQNAPHAHWTGFSPDNQFAFVPDLGLDQVVIYKAEATVASLRPFGFAALPGGSGPRHMKFHANGRWVYVLNELSLTVSFFRYDGAGGLELTQTVETVDKADLERELAKSCSEIRIHPNGQFVYAANRGHDTISVFQILSDGQLSRVQVEPVRGATPRNFNLSPDGRWLLAAGQSSHTLACFKVAPQSGWLTFNQTVISTPSPICVLFGRSDVK